MGWLIPIGTPGGVTSGFGDVPDRSGLVRLGDRIFSLDFDLYRLWQRAASVPQHDALLEWAVQEGIEDAEERVQTLLETGLLLNESADVSSRLSDLALCMLGELRGNGGDAAADFVV